MSFVTISVLSQFEFFLVLSQSEFKFCHNLSFWVLSTLEFFFPGFITIWFLEFHHNLNFGKILVFGIIWLFFSSVTILVFWILYLIWVLEFCHNFRLMTFWVFEFFVPQFEFLSFVTILAFELCHHLWFWVLSFITIWVFDFHHNLSFWVSSQCELFLVSSKFNFLKFCHKGPVT